MTVKKITMSVTITLEDGYYVFKLDDPKVVLGVFFAGLAEEVPHIFEAWQKLMRQAVADMLVKSGAVHVVQGDILPAGGKH
jgi:hypothetical protein